MVEKLIILGSGPAGYTAAIYSARAGLSPLLIEGSEPGGQLMTALKIENFPGFPKGIEGPELTAAMREQALRFGVKIIEGNVSKVELGKRPFKIVIPVRQSGGIPCVHSCEALIIATGARSKWLGLPSEKALRGKGVSSCATCDGFFFKGQDVVVVGGGDTALEEALYLSRFVISAAIIHRRDQLRGSKTLQDKAKANPKISFIWNSVVEDIKDASMGKVTAVILKDVKSGKTTEKKCDGVFVAIGHEPNTSVFKGQIKLDEKGYILIKGRSSATSVEGVFAAGDVADPVYRQAITAAGSGCMAAIDAEKFLGAK